MGNRAVERRRKLLRCVADQKSVLQPLEIGCKRRDSPGLWKAAGDAVDRLVAREGLFGSVGVGGLRIIDIAYTGNRIYQFLSMGEAGEALDAGDRGLGRQP